MSNYRDRLPTGCHPTPLPREHPHMPAYLLTTAQPPPADPQQPAPSSTSLNHAIILALIIALLCTLLLILMGYTIARRWLRPGTRQSKPERSDTASRTTPWQEAGQRAEPISENPDMDDD